MHLSSLNQCSDVCRIACIHVAPCHLITDSTTTSSGSSGTSHVPSPCLRSDPTSSTQPTLRPHVPQQGHVDALGHTGSRQVHALQGVLCSGRRQVRGQTGGLSSEKGATNPSGEPRGTVPKRAENRKSPHPRANEISFCTHTATWLIHGTSNFGRSGLSGGSVRVYGSPEVSGVM